MRIVSTNIPEVLILEPPKFSDDRGHLVVAFKEDSFTEAGLPGYFAQDNFSRSRQGVIRALHYQQRSPQGKLVTAITGEIFDVAVDVRRGSPTFGQWAGVTLRGDTPRFFWIPPGFAHGYAVLSDEADVFYKCTSVFDPDDQRGILWNDPTIGIPWPFSAPRLSAADTRQPLLADAMDALPKYTA